MELHYLDCRRPLKIFKASRKQTQHSAVISVQGFSCMDRVVLKFAAAMVRSAVAGERGCDSLNDVFIAFATAPSTDESRLVLSAGE